MKTKVSEKDDKSDVLKQLNKSHKGTKDKLKKKRDREKEIKKKKKDRKKEMELRKKKKKEKKEKKKEKQEAEESDEEVVDSEEKRDEKLLKYLQKLRIFMEEEADDLFEMFEDIDAGRDVNIEDLENLKVKNYLKKVFKYLELRKDPETKDYSKNEYQTEPMKPRITALWYKGVDSSSEGSDNEDKNESIEEERDFDEEEIKKEVDLEKAKKALMEGLQTLPEDEKTEEAEQKEEPNRIPGEEWRSFMDEQFGSMIGENQKGYSNLAKKGGVGHEERTDKDKQIDQFMNEFNSQYRKKTLLEEHQERKKAGAQNAGKERRAFDRDLDLNMSRIDSKKVFQMLTNKETSLSSRFGNSRSGNKYL